MGPDVHNKRHAIIIYLFGVFFIISFHLKIKNITTNPKLTQTLFAGSQEDMWHVHAAVSVTHIFFATLKIKVHYWIQWFHEEPLTSSKHFHSTKGSLLWKKFFRFCSLHYEKNGSLKGYLGNIGMYVLTGWGFIGHNNVASDLTAATLWNSALPTHPPTVHHWLIY